MQKNTPAISSAPLEEISCNSLEPDELEISLFGPGIGECLVVHLGERQWMVVYSCRGHCSPDPIAIEYLKSIGIDPVSAVRTIVISHWHDDHTASASELVRQCPQAVIYHPAALQLDE